MRAPTWDDLSAVVELVRACEAADEGESESTADDMRADWQLSGVDLVNDAWMVSDSEGRVAGYASIWERSQGLRYEASGYTHPEHRGNGIGTVLVRAVEARARGQAVAGAVVRTPVNHRNEGARDLLEHEGWQPARYYWRMVIELDGQQSPPSWPDGVSVRGFQQDADERAVHALIQETSADNHDFSPLEFDDWRRMMIERESFDAETFFLAISGDEIIGVALCPRYPGQGWLRQLAVQKEWRGRGMGSALLRHVFVELYRRGKRRVGLVVDSYNRTGAKELYERAGMSVERQHDGYEKSLG